MFKPANLLTLMLAAFSALALTACGGGSGGGQEEGTGTLSVGITDASYEDIEHVYVRFTGVTSTVTSACRRSGTSNVPTALMGSSS